MIKNLEDLINFQKNEILHADFLLSHPGCSEKEIEFLRQEIQGIPSSYLSSIQGINVNCVDIGYFGLYPFSRSPQPLVYKLIEAFKDPFFPKSFMLRHKIYQIGSKDTDLLCVSEGTENFKPGEILWILEGDNICNPQDSQIHKLAENFYQFLIISGNFWQICRELKEDRSDYEEKKEEFLNRLSILGVSQEYQETWAQLF
jgi:hypothetical protein